MHIPAWTLGDEDEWLGTYSPGDTRNQLHLDDPKLTELVKQRAQRAERGDAGQASIRQFVDAFHDQMYRVYCPEPMMITGSPQRVKGYVPTVRGYGYAMSLVGAWME